MIIDASAKCALITSGDRPAGQNVEIEYRTYKVVFSTKHDLWAVPDLGIAVRLYSEARDAIDRTIDLSRRVDLDVYHIRWTIPNEEVLRCRITATAEPGKVWVSYENPIEGRAKVRIADLVLRQHWQRVQSYIARKQAFERDMKELSDLLASIPRITDTDLRVGGKAGPNE